MTACKVHAVSITAYRWVMDFVVIDGTRHATMDTCVLSCGCIIDFASIDLDDSSDECAVVIRDMAGNEVFRALDNFEDFEGAEDDG